MKRQNGFAVLQLILVIIVIGVIGGVGFIVYKNIKSTPESATDSKTITNFDECVAAGNPVMDSFPEQCVANGQTFTNENQQADMPTTTTVTSGKKKFSVELPNTWGEVVKPLDSDAIYIMGTEQPEGKLIVSELEAFGTDAQSVFSIIIHDNFSPPEGVAQDYTLVNGKENPIKGKKYILTYDKDTEVGIGYLRLAGDRDYTYQFDLGNGSELRVHYSVYGSDPRNLITTVEAIIDSIRIL